MTTETLTAGRFAQTHPVAVDESIVRLRGRALQAMRVVWILVALVFLANFIVNLVPRWHQLMTPCDQTGNGCAMYVLTTPDVLRLQAWGIPQSVYAGYIIGLDLLMAGVLVPFGVFVFLRTRDQLIGFLASLSLVMFGLALIPETALTLMYEKPELRPLYSGLMMVGTLAFVPLLFMFPNGRFFPRWTPILAVLLCLNFSANILVDLFFTNKFDSAFLAFNYILAAGLVLAAVATQVHRYRSYSSLEERQQLKWLVLGATLMCVGGVLWGALYDRAIDDLPSGLWVNVLGLPGIYLLALGLPVSITVAILRYHLWDIDVILNRTLVYTMLTGFVIGAYVLIVAGLSAMLHSESNFVPSLAATGVIAVAFHPVHARLQRSTNRWLFGERDDPAALFTRLTAHLETADSRSGMLANLVETIAVSLKLPYAALWMLDAEGGVDLSASIGERPEDVESLPLLHRNTAIGRLDVAPRSPGEKFSEVDRRLLASVAQIAATTVRTVQLTDEVQESRVRMVTAREEERRRLRRDLHDGLGPVLASQALKLAAARQLLQRDPQMADKLLGDVIDQSEKTVGEVRRLVYALRPATLDEFGLIEAIREHIHTIGVPAGLQITVDALEIQPPISAAAEVAAFRIVQEALNNVVRHAQAHRCTVRLWIQDGLHVEVSDDGVGFPVGYRPGVGLHSMRERAAEVGGHCAITEKAGGEKGTGVVVRITLPLSDLA